MPTHSTLSSDQRSALLAAKLRAVIDARPGSQGRGAEVTATTLPGSAALARGGDGFVLLDDAPAHRVGAAIAWASRAGVERLDLFVDGDASEAVARRARHFIDPPRVWRVDGGQVVAAVPAPISSPIDPPEGTETLVAVLEAHGAEVVVEDGQVVGEVLGLEVARLLRDPVTGDPRLEVGVGRYDREVVAMLHQDLSSSDSLASVVDVVRRHRAPASEPHPLNRLVPERWLRSALIGDAGALGLDGLGLSELRPLPSPIGRRGLRDVDAAVAVGVRRQGRSTDPVVVACSVGVDLDLVPAAADARQWWAALQAVSVAEVGLLLVMPERDAHPITSTLAAALEHPAEVVAVPDDWRC